MSLTWEPHPQIFREVVHTPFGLIEIQTGAPNYRVTGSIQVGSTTLHIVGKWCWTVEEAKASFENSLIALHSWLNEGLKVIDGADTSAPDAGAVPASSTLKED